MPRDGATIFGDLVGKLEMLRVACDKCGREGSYRLAGLINRRGGDAEVIDWLDELTADCPKKVAQSMSHLCGCQVPAVAKGAVRVVLLGVGPRGGNGGVQGEVRGSNTAPGSRLMSAFKGKADIEVKGLYFRFRPKTEILCVPISQNCVRFFPSKILLR